MAKKLAKELEETKNQLAKANERIELLETQVVEGWTHPDEVRQLVNSLRSTVAALKERLRYELREGHERRCPICDKLLFGRSIHEVADMYACTHGHYYEVVDEDGVHQLVYATPRKATDG